jgi:hypothetical protein
MAVVRSNVYDEFAEFLTSSPTLHQLAEFRLSETLEARIGDLLAANREGQLTAQEAAELDDALRLEHLMRAVKIRAYEKLGCP